MNKIEGAIHELNIMEKTASKDNAINRLHPLSKLIVTVIYTAIAVSFDSRDISGLLSMFLYQIIIFTVAELNLKSCVKRIWIIMPFVCLIGIANPFLDRETVLYIGTFAVTGGMLSMAGLILKGVLTVTAAYILIATTKIEAVCRALRILYVPETFVTVILLIYRYITMFLQEVNRMTQSYALRAPNQKGINYKVWGSFAGRLLLRAMDRASLVYESMCLRGFSGEFPYYAQGNFALRDVCYLVLWTTVIILLRNIRLFELVGGLFIK